jgi:hypothetical protein
MQFHIMKNGKKKQEVRTQINQQKYRRSGWQSQGLEGCA